MRFSNSCSYYIKNTVYLFRPKEKELGKYVQYWPNDEKQTFTSPKCTVDVLKISERTEHSVCVRKLRIFPSGTLDVIANLR